MAEPAATPTWLPPTLQPVRPLGVGGFGEVWLARDVASRREVAVKRMLMRPQQEKELAESERLRFKREYATLRRLNHPGIVRMLGAGEVNGDPWFMMDFVAGLPLHEYLESGQWTQPAPVVESKKPAAAAETKKTPGYYQTAPGLAQLWQRAAELFEILSYLHGEGLVHRDLKPGNLMVDAGGRLKLIDFGLTRAMQGDDQVTLGGSILGTVSFMSPEQIRNQRLDGRSDLYAVGAMLYLLATGVVPYDGPIPTVVMMHLIERPLAPSQRNGLLTGEPEAFILKLLAKEPGARYRDAAACLHALQAFSGVHSAPPAASGAAIHRPVVSGAIAGLLAAPFIGNDAALAAVKTRCEALQGGRGAARRLSGPAGAGKTRLAEAAAGLLAVQGVLALEGRTSADGDGALFAEVFTALADRAVANPSALDWPRREFAILSLRYAPLARVDALPPVQPLDGPAGRRRFIAAAVGALRAIARQRPLLLRLEELQPADELSLEIVALLAEFLEGSEPLPLLLLMMSRPDESAHPPTGDTPRARVEAAAEVVALLPLNREESGRLLAAWLGQETAPPKDFIETLWLAAQGNPGLLAAALNGLIGDGSLRRDEKGGWQFADALSRNDDNGKAGAALPHDPAAAAAAQIASLPPTLHAALRAAAFIGAEFHFNWWIEIAASDAEELHAATGEAIRLGLLADAGRGRLRFLSEEHRAQLDAETTGRRRARQHARVLSVLEAGAPDPDKELPLKVRHALGSSEAEPAFRHGHRLARRYLDNGQAAMAAPLLENLRASIDAAAVDAIPAARRLTQLVLEVALSAIGNDHPRTVSLCRDALGLARQLRRPVEERELQRRLSYALNGLGAYPSAKAASERAHKLAEEAGDERDQVRAMLQRAIALRSLHDVPGANACLEEAELRAAAVHDDALGGVIATEQGIVRWEAGELAGAARAFDKARRLAEKAGNDLVLATALGNGAEIALETGRLAEGEAALQRALEINRTLGVRTLQADNLNNLGLVRHLRGDPEGAREYLNEALKLAKALDDNFLQAFAQLRLAAVALVCGEDDAAAAGAQIARRLFATSSYAPGEARARLIESELALRAGAYGEAREAAESALVKTESTGGAPLTAQALAGRALAIRLQSGPLDPGMILEAERLAEASGHLLARLLVSLRHARLLLCDKNPAAARPLLVRTLADAKAAGFHWQVKEAEELLKSLR